MALGLADALAVNTDELRARAAEAAEKVTRMKNAFQNLEEILQQTQGYWSGIAADAHRDYFSQKKEEIETAVKRLQEDVGDLEQMAGVYETAEKEAGAASADLPGDIVT